MYCPILYCSTLPPDINPSAVNKNNNNNNNNKGNMYVNRRCNLRRQKLD